MAEGTSGQAGTARAADSERIKKLAPKADRATQLAVVLHPCKAPVTGYFLSPLMRRLFDLASALPTYAILKHIQREPASVQTVHLPHRLQHLALDGRSGNPLLRLLLGDRPTPVSAADSKQRKESG